MLLWLTPVAAGLLLAIPVSVLTSYPSLGVLARRAKLFMTPDETTPPREVLATAQYAATARPLPRFADAVTDPEVSAVVQSAALNRAAVRRSAGSGRSALAAVARAERVQRALASGPEKLSQLERVTLLHDGVALEELQRAAAPAPPRCLVLRLGSAGRATSSVWPRSPCRRPALWGGGDSGNGG